MPGTRSGGRSQADVGPALISHCLGCTVAGWLGLGAADSRSLTWNRHFPQGRDEFVQRVDDHRCAPCRGGDDRFLAATAWPPVSILRRRTAPGRGGQQVSRRRAPGSGPMSQAALKIARRPGVRLQITANRQPRCSGQCLRGCQVAGTGISCRHARRCLCDGSPAMSPPEPECHSVRAGAVLAWPQR